MALCLLLVSCGKGTEEPLPVQEETQPAQEDVQPAEEEPQQTPEVLLADGVYSAEFRTDSSMFHVNEANDNRGVLTVADGKMTIHVSLASKSIVNLYPGLAEDAMAEGAELLMPTLDTVTYSDGMTEEVNGFDIPVPYLEEEFDCALIGTKGKWYDHKVYVTGVVPLLEDGEYTAAVTLSGGTGKASVDSPARLFVEDGKITAEIVWSSTHYEYMVLDEVQYDRLDGEGNSTFLIPVVLDEDIAVSALTTAMSEPHLIDYVLHFDGATLEKKADA